MQVHVGVVVPAEVLAPITRLVEEARAVPLPTHAAPRRRLFGRDRTPPAAPASVESPVLPVPAGQAHVSIAVFGNLPTGDVQRLGDVIAEAAADWPAPRLHVAGVDGQEQPGAVGVALGGELDALTAVARGVTGSVEALGLFVDRRRFRPAVVVAQVAAASAPDADTLARVRAALAGHHGEPWTVDHLSLLKVEHDAGVRRFAELRQLPLGPTR